MGCILAIANAFFSAICNLGAGLSVLPNTREEREQTAEDMRQAHTRHPTNVDMDSWNRHLSAMDQPQPDEWKCKDDPEVVKNFWSE